MELKWLNHTVATAADFESNNNLLLVTVIIIQTDCVKMDVEGTVSIGKDVMETLSGFLGSTSLNGRRFLRPESEDPIIIAVRTTSLCHNLAFCQHISKLVEEFITTLALSLKTVLNQMLPKSFNDIVFEQHLKHYVDVSKNVLESANTKIKEDLQVYYWIDTIKVICSRFLEMSAIIVMEANPKEVAKVKDELNRKLILATVLVEMKYQTKLCADHDICVKSYKVTESLNNLLKGLNASDSDKVRLFIKYFYETLFDTAFYTHVGEKIGNVLQVILNDMVYSSEVPAKDILSTLQKIVEARVDAIETRKNVKMSHDASLVHVILSDMDHIYSTHTSEPFKQFFKHFYDWFQEVDVTMGRAIREVMKDIGAKFQTVPDNLLVKLIGEVRVFLDITIEPENNSS